MTQHFCHEIVVDHQKNEIRLDGVPLPYWVEPDPEIELPKGAQAHIGILRIGIFAESITYIGKEGGRKTLLEASPRAHSEWARRRAREIVYDGMADVLGWLEQAKLDREEAEAEAYQRGVQKGILSQQRPVGPVGPWENVGYTDDAGFGRG